MPIIMPIIFLNNLLHCDPVYACKADGYAETPRKTISCLPRFCNFWFFFDSFFFRLLRAFRSQLLRFSEENPAGRRTQTDGAHDTRLLAAAGLFFLGF